MYVYTWMSRGMDEVRGVTDGRVDSQTMSAGSGLMDNVPLDHKLPPTRHDWYWSAFIIQLIILAH